MTRTRKPSRDTELKRALLLAQLAVLLKNAGFGHESRVCVTQVMELVGGDN